MINIKPVIYDALSNEFDNVNDTYPSDWAKFPVIQYVEEDNSTLVKTDNTEKLAYIRFKIDIWNSSSTSDAAIKVDEIISGLGLKRIASNDVPDPSGLKHKIMRFEGIIDVNNLRVYN